MLALGLTLSLSARADERSGEILDRIASILRGYANYEVMFTVSANGMDDIEGVYFVSGDRYNITVADQNHFSDGTYRYEINNTDREIIIDWADVTSHNMLSNPAMAFEFVGDDFEGVYRGTCTVSGRECETVRLIPVGASYGPNIIITLYVSGDSGLPVVVEYDYEGEKVHIAIDNISPVRQIDAAMFAFDGKKYKGYEIIDFR